MEAIIFFTRVSNGFSKQRGLKIFRLDSIYSDLFPLFSKGENPFWSGSGKCCLTLFYTFPTLKIHLRGQPTDLKT